MCARDTAFYYNTWPWSFSSYEGALNPLFTGAEVFEPAAGKTPTLTFDNRSRPGKERFPPAPPSTLPAYYRYPINLNDPPPSPGPVQPNPPYQP